MVECLTGDRGGAGSSLTGSTAGDTYPLLSTSSTQEDPYEQKKNEWDVKNQIKKKLKFFNFVSNHLAENF